MVECVFPPARLPLMPIRCQENVKVGSSVLFVYQDLAFSTLVIKVSLTPLIPLSSQKKFAHQV